MTRVTSPTLPFAGDSRLASLKTDWDREIHDVNH